MDKNDSVDVKYTGSLLENGAIGKVCIYVILSHDHHMIVRYLIPMQHRTNLLNSSWARAR